MDITSYLLGKKNGGVTPTGEVEITENGIHNVSGYATANVDVEPDLESKEVTITENTTTTITPSAGKDGLSGVNVITNVAGTFVVPSGVNLRFQNSTTNDWTFLNNIDFSNITDYSYTFDACTGLTEMPTLDTGGVTNMTGMFRGCNNLVTTKLYNTSACTSFLNMFYGCTKLTTAPAIDTSKATSFSYVFTGCTLLRDVPVFNLSSVTGAYYMTDVFKNCPALTNESLNNIMASFLTATNYPGTKTLKYMGLSSAQATTCKTLSNWAALSAAGWTTGY